MQNAEMAERWRKELSESVEVAMANASDYDGQAMGAFLVEADRARAILGAYVEMAAAMDALWAQASAMYRDAVRHYEALEHADDAGASE